MPSPSPVEKCWIFERLTVISDLLLCTPENIGLDFSAEIYIESREAGNTDDEIAVISRMLHSVLHRLTRSCVDLNFLTAEAEIDLDKSEQLFTVAVLEQRRTEFLIEHRSAGNTGIIRLGTA